MAGNSPKTVFEAACNAGCSRGRLSPGREVFVALLGGALFGLGGLLAMVVGQGNPEIAQANPGVAALISGGVFPLGAVLVILTGAHLFPDNCSLIAPAFLVGAVRWKELLRNWGLVYLGNLLGSLFVAYFLGYWTGIANVGAGGLGEVVGGAAAKMAEGKVALDWGPALLRGLGCSWLVCLAAWLAIASNGIVQKILAIWLPTMAFLALGFEHCVANMFFVPLGMLNGAQVTVGDFILSNLLPVTIGNIIGGAGFVGVAYWLLYGRD